MCPFMNGYITPVHERSVHERVHCTRSWTGMIFLNKIIILSKNAQMLNNVHTLSGMWFFFKTKTLAHERVKIFTPWVCNYYRPIDSSRAWSLCVCGLCFLRWFDVVECSRKFRRKFFKRRWWREFFWTGGTASNKWKRWWHGHGHKCTQQHPAEVFKNRSRRDHVNCWNDDDNIWSINHDTWSPIPRS